MIYNVQHLTQYQLFIEFIYADGKTEVLLYKQDAILLARELMKAANELDNLVKQKGGEE